METLTALFRRFLHWKGWAALARWRGWTSWLKWPGWRVLLFPHPLIIGLLVPLCAAGLGWIFLEGLEEHPAAYPAYCLSFYALTVLVLRLPGLGRRISRALHANSVTGRYLTDRGLRFSLSLYIDQGVNLGYGVLRILSGFLYGSTWLLTDGLYNLVQGAIQLFQSLRRRKTLTLKQQWQSYRLCGLLILVMHLTMTGVVFQMIHRDHAERYPGYMIFATAAFAFYKLIHAFIRVAKDRRHEVPIDSAVRLLKLSQALFSLFSLQTAMFQAFGGDFEFRQLMNSITGGTVCLLVVLMGVYMLRRAREAIKNL